MHTQKPPARPTPPVLRRRATKCPLPLAWILPACIACGSASPSGFDVGGSQGEAEAGAPGFGAGAPNAVGAGGASSGGSGGGPEGTIVLRGADAGTTPSSAATGPSAPPTSVAINDCPGNLSPATVSALQAGGPVPASMKWLYPYEGTVFPGGLPAPTLQWSQTSPPDGAYLHLHSKSFDYAGCFAGGDPPELAIPQTAWDKAWEQGTGVNDPLTVEVTTVTGGIVAGPLRESLSFARGSLKGVVYYNTYTSQIAGNNGAVMS
ncbi:MAG: hypothetical protein WBY94_08760, partial [Polyangiaceae bacterium]